MKKISLIIFILFLAINLQVFSRYYNPDIGRFISADIVTPGGGADLEGLNRYTYCDNNPIAYVDPTGHEAETSSSGTGLKFNLIQRAYTLAPGEWKWENGETGLYGYSQFNLNGLKMLQTVAELSVFGWDLFPKYQASIIQRGLYYGCSVEGAPEELKFITDIMGATSAYTRGYLGGTMRYERMKQAGKGDFSLLKGNKYMSAAMRARFGAGFLAYDLFCNSTATWGNLNELIGNWDSSSTQERIGMAAITAENTGWTLATGATISRWMLGNRSQIVRKWVMGKGFQLGSNIGWISRFIAVGASDMNMISMLLMFNDYDPRILQKQMQEELHPTVNKYRTPETPYNINNIRLKYESADSDNTRTQ